ncbi:MAG: orotidine-5'-phosphate decarboxylase [Verrucomicrobia bacterium]|nr:orotidine-5'-phosphate decarboxylase [Verrucomicrobiota bacterium]
MQAQSVKDQRPAKDKIIIPLDVSNRHAADHLIEALIGHATWFKVGLQLFCAAGPGIACDIKSIGAKLFLDLKLHDIPNTVEHAAEAVSGLKADFLTVHLLGGRAMSAAAKNRLAETQVLGVTVLTSHDQESLNEIGLTDDLTSQVLRLASVADSAGLDGLVASPLEIAPLRNRFGSRFKLVIPGIRPAWSVSNDQKRTLSPSAALAAGADYLVIGRPITGAPVPAEAFQRVVDELETTG